MASRTILGIVGSYRKLGVIDKLVTHVLAGAEQAGATTSKVYLLDKQIEFCTNCRQCTQGAGETPGRCVLDDDMADLLEQVARADGLVLGAPVNFFNINALTRRFMERLVCFAYWPWGQAGPSYRVKSPTKKAVLVTSSAMPAVMGRVFTGAPRALRLTARTMGAKPIATVYPGLIAQQPKPALSPRHIRKARRAGAKLAAAIS